MGNYLPRFILKQIIRSGMSLSLVCLLFISGVSNAADFQEQDKQMHAMASFGIAGISYGAARAAKYSRWTSAFVSSVLTLSVGYIKESNDKKFDQQDMEANASGTAMGIMLPMSFSF